MGNVPVVMIGSHKIKPEYQERFGKWVTEVYYPLMIKIPHLNSLNRYVITGEKSEYPKNFTLYRYNNLKSFEQFMTDPIVISIMKDMKTTFVDTGRSEWFWRAAYELMRTFNNQSGPPVDTGNQTENGPSVHLEGYRLFPDEEDKYNNWISKWGFEFYIPALMRIPGIRRYDFDGLVDYKFPEWLRPKISGIHPSFLSILHFDSLESYQSYEKSIEVAALRQALNEHFRRDFEFKWSVQYRQIFNIKK